MELSERFFILWLLEKLKNLGFCLLHVNLGLFRNFWDFDWIFDLVFGCLFRSELNVSVSADIYCFWVQLFLAAVFVCALRVGVGLSGRPGLGGGVLAGDRIGFWVCGGVGHGQFGDGVEG